MATISAKTGKVPGVVATFDYNLGKTTAQALELFGEELVFSYYISGATVALQNVARNLLEAGVIPEEIPAEMASFKLGTKRARVAADPVMGILAILQDPNTSDERKKEILAQIKKAASGS